MCIYNKKRERYVYIYICTYITPKQHGSGEGAPSMSVSVNLEFNPRKRTEDHNRGGTVPHSRLGICVMICDS